MSQQLVARVERIYQDGYRFWDEPGWSRAALSERAAELAEALAATLGREVHHDPPDDVSDHHRLTVGFDVAGPSRSALDFDRIASVGRAIFLEVICALNTPVSEASWHTYECMGPRLLHDSRDLRAPGHLPSSVDSETLDAIEAALADSGWPLAPHAVTRTALSGLPAPFPEPAEAQLRHYLFPGCAD